MALCPLLSKFDPQNCCFLDLSFATILARRIHKLLQEKDERAGTKASDWLRLEALSGTGIQENGTFRKALWQRVYSSVIPIFSEVIAYVDRDSNLDLVMEEGTWLSCLWIALFQNPSMVELHYENFLSLESGIIRERVPVTTSGRERHTFDLQFPFSWLIKERIDAMWKDAASIAGKLFFLSFSLVVLLKVFNCSVMGYYQTDEWMTGVLNSSVSYFRRFYITYHCQVFRS